APPPFSSNGFMAATAVSWVYPCTRPTVCWPRPACWSSLHPDIRLELPSLEPAPTRAPVRTPMQTPHRVATAGCLVWHKSLTMTYFHRRTSTIIGAKAFHVPVRDGKEWGHLAMVVKRKGVLGRCSCQGTVGDPTNLG